MSNFNRMMAKELAELGGGKIIRGNVMGNIDPLVEWIKWLSYQPYHEEEKIKLLFQKSGYELSIDDLNYLSKYKDRKRMLKLFKKYSDIKCNSEEYMEVYDYMGNSIFDLIFDKLSLEELRTAKQKINSLLQIPQDELRIKISKEQEIENYLKLSMVDSYILHIISDIDYSRCMNELNIRIENQLKENEIMMQKSLHYNAKPCL